MGKFLDFLTGGGSGAVGGLIGNIIQAIQGRKNRKVQQQENQKDRDFNAAEAQKQRDFEEKMYKEYESPTAQARQREAAGLSPLEGVSSQPVGGGSSASSSSSSLPAAPTLDMSWLTSMGETVATIRKTNAETKLLQQQSSKEYYNTIKAAFEADPTRMQETYNEELARLKADKEAKIISNREYQARVDMLEEFRNNGGNTYQDEHDYLMSRLELNKSEAELKKSLKESEDAFRDGTKAKIEAEAFATRVQALLSQRYGPALNLADINLRQAQHMLTIKQIRAQNIDNDLSQIALDYEKNLKAAGLSAAQAEAQAAAAEASIKHWLYGDNADFPLLGKLFESWFISGDAASVIAAGISKNSTRTIVKSK